MTVSIVVPTYNRAETLRKTLLGYASQTGDHRILEIVVVDDGSTDHTLSVVDDFRHRSMFPIRYLHQNNRGLAAARNHAIREVRGSLILFGDDDVIPGPHLVAEHVQGHASYPEMSTGILGYVPYAAELRPTPFMVWEGLYGPQFHFGLFDPGGELDYWHAYFCNTSVKTAFLKENGYFDERFVAYGWEDLELSYRLYQRGWRVRYNPKAIGYHYKLEKFDQALRRAEQVWWRGWPVYLTTEAGKDFNSRLQAYRAQSGQSRRSAARRMLRGLKALAMPVLRSVMDSHIKLPRSAYELVWNYYSASIVEVAYHLQPDNTQGAPAFEQTADVSKNTCARS